MKKIIFILAIPVFLFSGCGEKHHEEHHEEHQRAVEMKRDIQESIGLTTAPAEKKKIIADVDVYGVIAQDTENTMHVSPKTSCVLKSLKVEVGQTVDEKSPIATVETEAGMQDILSPCHGVVISKYVKEGEKIDSLTSIVTIANPDVLRASFDVYEKDLSAIKLDQNVKVTTVAYPEKTFVGKVVFISPRVDDQTRTIKIRVDIENKEHLLKFGMFVTGRIEKEAEMETIVVPLESVQTIDSGKVVFVKTGEETFLVKEVKVRQQTEYEAAITEGLNEGEIVVVKGSFILKSELQKEELGGHDHA
jgi:multidrug efflux pump subunit AcrA (membrane-fusion protein)